MHSPQEVVAFWFQLGAERWFTVDPDLDARIRDRFEDTYDKALVGACDDWASTPRGALALVIVLDQFPRNMFRGTARMYEADAIALATTKRAVEAGFDSDLTQPERMVLYMPFQHSENGADQDRSVRLYEALTELPKAIESARRHRDVVARFGRFPHRNTILGRETTADEATFLEQPDAHF